MFTVVASAKWLRRDKSTNFFYTMKENNVMKSLNSSKISIQL